MDDATLGVIVLWGLAGIIVCFVWAAILGPRDD